MPRVNDGDKLTKTIIDRLEVTGKLYIMWCNEPSAFGVQVTPSGHKSYVYYYRNGMGKERRPTIAAVTDITVDQARKIAKKKLLEVANGVDPVEATKVQIAEKKAEKSVAEVWAEFKEFCEAKMNANRMSPVTYEGYQDLYRLYMEKQIGKWPIKSLDLSNLTDEFNKLTKEKGIYAANHWRRLISNILNRAEEWKYRPVNSNPCKLIKLSKQNKRTQLIPLNVKAGIAAKLKELRERQAEDIYALAYIECLIYGGGRKTEILTLKHDDCFLDDACAWLPNAKGEPVLKALPPQVVEIIRSLPKVKGNPYVFASPKTLSHWIGVQRVWSRIRKQIPGAETICFHLLRHNAATTGVDLKLGVQNIAGFLSHKDVQSTATYMHNSMGEKREVAAMIGSKIAEDFDPSKYKAPEQKVVSINGYRGGR